MLNWRLVTCSWHVFTNPEFIIFQSCNVFFFYYVQQKNIHFFHKKIHTKCLWNIFVDGGFVKVFDEHVKVQVFWEGHKNLANLPLFFWQYLVTSNYKWKMSQNFVAFSEYRNFVSGSFVYTPGHAIKSVQSKFSMISDIQNNKAITKWEATPKIVSFLQLSA